MAEIIAENSPPKPKNLFILIPKTSLSIFTSNSGYIETSAMNLDQLSTDLTSLSCINPIILNPYFSSNIFNSFYQNTLIILPYNDSTKIFKLLVDTMIIENSKLMLIGEGKMEKSDYAKYHKT